MAKARAEKGTAAGKKEPTTCGTVAWILTGTN